MKFTSADKKYLLWVYREDKDILAEDMEQLMAAADVTKYKLMTESKSKGTIANVTTTVTKSISRTMAIRLLGRNAWLNGLSRSAFHQTAVRDVDEGRYVYFDSSELFK